MPGPDDSGPASVPSSPPPAPQSGPRVGDEDEPPSSGPVSARDADEAAPPSSGTYTLVTRAIVLFVSSRKPSEGRDFVIRVVKKRLGDDIPRAMLEDIVQGALAEAAECRWPPWTVAGVPGWLARVTRRQIAAYFRKEKGREDKPKRGKEDKPEPTARPRSATAKNAEAARLEVHDDAEHASRVEPRERTEWIADRSAPPTDERARARLIHDWLAKQIGDDPRKVRTLELMKEHAVDGFTLAELAEREKTTERALANRFHKLRKELAPQVRLMDDEKTRRNGLLLAIFFGGALLLALLVWLLMHLFAPPPPPPITPAPEATPSASAVAPPPVFNQALPTPSESVEPPEPPTPVGPK